MRIDKIKKKWSLAGWGDVCTEKREYCPLEVIKVTIIGREDKDDKECELWVTDSAYKEYYRQKVKLNNNHAHTEFEAGGKAGVHTMYISFGDICVSS